MEPLDAQEDWKLININGKNCIRETDTLDTFVDSSWYFLRFCSSNKNDAAFDKIDFRLLDASRSIHRRCGTCNPTFIVFQIFHESYKPRQQRYNLKKNHLRDCLLKVWFVMKPTKMKMIIGSAQKK